MIKISIITVTFNSGLTINDTVNSVLAQTYANIEYLIIDGCSTDSTLAILNEYPENSFALISEPDSGIYDAINKGIRLATGDVVGVLNSDDFYAAPDVVSKIANEFTKEPALEAVYSDVMYVDQFDISKKIRHYSSKFFNKYLFRFGMQPAHPSFYAKKYLFEKYGYYRTDLRIAGDFELLMRFLLLNKVRYKYIAGIWVMMRIGGVSSAGFQSLLRLNNEIVSACRYNNLYTNRILVYSKYLFKWWGFLKQSIIKK